MIDFSFDPLLDSLNMAAKTLHEWATQVTKSFNRVSKSYMPKPDLEIELCSISKKTGENIGECTVNIYDDQGCKIGSFHAEDITINK
jgi:hypothetical protein